MVLRRYSRAAVAGSPPSLTLEGRRQPPYRRGAVHGDAFGHCGEHRQTSYIPRPWPEWQWPRLCPHRPRNRRQGRGRRTGALLKCEWSRFRTFDGIETAGRRLKEELLEVTTSTPDVASLTVIGHSLGGMYLRQMMFLLHSEHADFLAGLDLRALVTLATPHLGIRRPQRSPFNFAFQHGAQSFRSGAELSLEVRRADNAPPLLWRIATEEAYLAPLRRFRRRVLCSNVFHDVQVFYSTGAIRPFNPYRNRARLDTATGLGPLDPSGDAHYPSITAASIDHPAARETYGPGSVALLLVLAMMLVLLRLLHCHWCCCCWLVGCKAKGRVSPPRGVRAVRQGCRQCAPGLQEALVGR